MYSRKTVIELRKIITREDKVYGTFVAVRVVK